MTVRPELDLDQYRKELTGYCYRMLGSAFEAEDAVQETLVRAWRAYDRFEGRSSVRRWLYRIATNVCLRMLETRGRRALPMDLGDPSPGDAIRSEPRADLPWLEPVPDDRVLTPTGDPADLAVARESIRLAFVAALQHLPARQRAVLILRDVLRWRSTEVAALLDTSVVSVNSALQRAREALEHRRGRATSPAPADDEAQRRLVERYVDAFVRFDLDTLVTLLRDDVRVSMPPFEMWLRGPGEYVRFLAQHVGGHHDLDLRPVAANGSPGFAVFRKGDERVGIQVVEPAGDGIAAVHMFLEPRLFDLFGLPGHEGDDPRR